MSFNYNQATLMGRLTRDPEFRQLNEKARKTTFTLAISRGFRKDGAEAETDFIPVCLWGRVADVAFQILKKGAPVLVCGRIQVSTYDKNNEKRWRTEIVVDSFQLLGSMKKQETSTEEETIIEIESPQLEVETVSTAVPTESVSTSKKRQPAKVS